MFEITFWPIFVAALANLAIGYVWYNPKAFGTRWANESGVPMGDMGGGKNQMLVSMGVSGVAAMMVAYVMNHFGIAWGVFDWIGAIELGFWTWLGFVAPTMLGMVLWERKSFTYYAIVSGNWLVSFIVMAIILVLLG